MTTENDVAIAAIQAQTAIEINNANNETAVELAEIHAETTETLHNESNEQWHLNSLEDRIRELEAENLLLKATPPPSFSPEAETTEALETMAEELQATDLTPVSMSEETSSIQTEVSERSEDAKPEAEVIIPLLELERKPKIQLV